MAASPSKMVTSSRAASPGATRPGSAPISETADDGRDLADSVSFSDSDQAEARLLGQAERQPILIDGAARSLRCQSAAGPRRIVKAVLLVGTLCSLVGAATFFSARGNPLRRSAGMGFHHLAGYAEASVLSVDAEKMGDNAMDTLDKDGDSKASLSEVEIFAKAKGLDYASTLAEFAGFDQDKDGNLDAEELGHALSEGPSADPNAPAMLCGKIACAAKSVCCHGLCGAPDWFCCGRILCAPNSICCPGLFGSTICCSNGWKCCGGVCIENVTKCIFDEPDNETVR